MTSERIDWSDWPELTCSECRQDFRISERNTRAWLRGERSGEPICPDCRDRKLVGPPGPEEHAWVEALPPARLDTLLRCASLLRAT